MSFFSPESFVSMSKRSHPFVIDLTFEPEPENVCVQRRTHVIIDEIQYRCTACDVTTFCDACLSFAPFSCSNCSDALCCHRFECFRCHHPLCRSCHSRLQVAVGEYGRETVCSFTHRYLTLFPDPSVYLMTFLQHPPVELLPTLPFPSPLKDIVSAYLFPSELVIPASQRSPSHVSFSLGEYECFVRRTIEPVYVACIGEVKHHQQLVLRVCQPRGQLFLFETCYPYLSCTQTVAPFPVELLLFLFFFDHCYAYFQQPC